MFFLNPYPVLGRWCSVGLFKLFKSKQEDIAIEPATTGRVLKEMSELNLTQSDREILLDLYQSIMSIDDPVDDQWTKLRFISYLARLILDLPLTAIDNPYDSDEYISHTLKRLQSSRCKSLFSLDAGKQWYDVDNDTWMHRVYRWIYKNIFKSSKHTPKFITSRMMPYVTFPYTKNIKQSYLK